LTPDSLNAPTGPPSNVRLALVIMAGPRPELVSRSPTVRPTWKLVRSWSSGRTEWRLWVRIARASSTDTAREATATTAAHAATTKLASTGVNLLHFKSTG
jgi:hypothetical protein